MNTVPAEVSALHVVRRLVRQLRAGAEPVDMRRTLDTAELLGYDIDDALERVEDIVTAELEMPGDPD